MGVHHALMSPPSVKAASTAMSNAQAAIKDAASMTNAQAAQVTRALDSPDRATALPSELQAFTKNTEHLTALRNDLCRDRDAYQAAADAKIASFDHEAGNVADDRSGRALQRLRRRTEQDIQERLANAQSVIDELDAVLAKGSDLQHTANAVLIADDLRSHGEELDHQLATARRDAAQYAATTNALLARITTALAE